MEYDIQSLYENILTLSDREFEKYINTVGDGILIEYLIDLLDNTLFLDGNSIILIRTISILVNRFPHIYTYSNKKETSSKR